MIRFDRNGKVDTGVDNVGDYVNPRQSIADALDVAVAALRKFLKDNNPNEFGCACEPETDGYPGLICGPCRTRIKQVPLQNALRQIGANHAD